MDINANTESNPGNFFWYKLVNLENIVGSSGHTYNVATISGVHTVEDARHLPSNQPITAYDRSHLNYDKATTTLIDANFYDSLPYV